ncbi:uncharacterized protein LOC112220775 isoform X2 [Oncorhynchus tshawytscha]|uniref:uncharacterized protein LOC112220775 isoform X2 n=1 Tax=Oncorhynchus tshawytscha TaxID=74940 RepID=UPI001C3CB1BB|nr:uncharacterized protein LOC112220775 isoform X2 [Oncorhynchus tshawytscha]
MFMMFGLLIMSAESAYGMVTSCNATQNMLCYGPLGGTVYLQLMNDATGSELTFKKDPTGAKTVIFRIKQNKIVHEFIKARSEFFINNGTFKINNTERSDSAEYSLEIFKSDGHYLDTRVVQLIIGGGSYCTARGSPVAVVLVLAVVVGAYCIHKRRNPPQASGMETPCDATLDGAQCYGTLGGTDSLQLMTIRSGGGSRVSGSRSPCPSDGVGSLLCLEEQDTSKDFSQDVEYTDVRILKKQMRQKERKVDYGQVEGGPRQPMEMEYGQIKTLEGPQWKTHLRRGTVCTPGYAKASEQGISHLSPFSLCIYTCVFCLPVASLSSPVKSYKCIPVYVFCALVFVFPGLHSFYHSACPDPETAFHSVPF